MNTITVPTDAAMVVLGFLGMMIFVASLFPYWETEHETTPAKFFPQILWLVSGLFGASFFIIGLASSLMTAWRMG